MRLGLCCKFSEAAIKFRNTTAKATGRLSRKEQRQKLAGLCLQNGKALRQALEFCRMNGIGDFRVNSQILPLKTHPQLGYDIADLPQHEKIVQTFKSCGDFARESDLRTSLHPDQFVLLNSPRDEVTRKSIAELEYQAMVSEWIGADVLNIHAGGAYGDKQGALRRLVKNIDSLSQRVRERLTIENDDRIYTPAELLQVCEATAVPLVYDVHHHRCLPDGLSVAEATERALATWDREALFHISSPREGWGSTRPQIHHDYIDPADFPECWLDLDITVEVEAKAKELALQRLIGDLEAGRVSFWNAPVSGIQ